jgi:hypothetical protein
MKNIKFSLFYALLSSFLSTSSVMAVELDIKGGVTVERIPKNAADTVTGWFGRSEDQYSYKTGNNLYISDVEKKDGDKGSVKLNFKIYSPFVMDSFIQIYNSENKISEVKIIEGKSAPEDLLSSGYEMITEGPVDIYKYNLLDPRSTYKETDVELEIKPGEHVDFSTSSSNVLVYNLIIAGLNMTDFGLGLTKTSETKKLVASFVKELYVKGEIDLVALDLTKDNRIKNNLLENPNFSKLMNNFEKFLKIGKDSAQAVAVGKLSDQVENFVAKLGPPGAFTAGASKLVFGATKVSNFTLRTSQALDQYGKQKPPFSLAVATSNQTLNDWQSWLPESGIKLNQQNQAMQDYSSCITQSSASHIGSASCFISRNAAQIADYKQRDLETSRFPSLQKRNEYTNGQIVSAPLDIGLTWDQSNKLDLDSHLVTPTNEHVYFSQRGDLNQSPNSFLYRDSIPNGGLKGAEQTRISQFQQGEYRFYVYNYSEADGQEAARLAGSNGLSNSGATVKLYEGGAPLTNIPNDPAVFDLNNPNVQKVGAPYPGDSTFKVPVNQTGNTWYVFKLNTRTGILYRVDRFGNSPDSSNVPKVR